MEGTDHFVNVDGLWNNIPHDTLTAIFKFLPLEDLKNCRLVNRFWYDSCTIGAITNKEKFVFSYGMYGGSTDCLARYILACRRIRQTIEFRGFSLRTLPSSVWEHIGQTVRSLRIHDCNVSPRVAYEIISRCSSLVHLHLQVCSSYTNRIFSHTTMDNLIAKNVERSALKSFKLFTSFYPIENADFPKIFQIFPKITTFSRDFVFYNESMDPVIDFLSELPRSVQRIGLRITLALRRAGSEVQLTEAKKTICEIFTRFPKIKALNFESNCSMAFTNEELDRFLRATQHLESLHLKFRDITLVDGGSTNHVFPAVQYKFLKDLRLTVPAHSQNGVSSRICFEILRRCNGSLKYLDLPEKLEMTDSIMDSIRTDHIGLKALSVPSMKCHGDCDFEWDPIALNQFSDLRFLSINFRNKSCAEHILPTIDLSKLKVFRTESVNAENMIELLSILPIMTPKLETLCLLAGRVDNNALPYYLHIQDFIQYLQRLQKLRFLILDKRWREVDYETIEDLFRKCPSLVYIIFPSLKLVFVRTKRPPCIRQSWYKANIYDSIGAYLSEQYPGL